MQEVTVAPVKPDPVLTSCGILLRESGKLEIVMMGKDGREAFVTLGEAPVLVHLPGWDVKLDANPTGGPHVGQ